MPGLTALALVPDWSGQACKFVQTLRRRHASQVRVWPPHINIIYPFVADAMDPPVADKLRVVFRRVAYFKNGSSCVAYLDPEEAGPIRTLAAECRKLAEFAEEHEFVPHLTVGTFSSEESCRDFIAGLPPFVISMDLELCVLTRSDLQSPFCVQFQSGEMKPYVLEDPQLQAHKNLPEFWQTDGQQLRLVLKAELGQASDAQVLCVIDKSASMGGSWDQVQAAVKYILDSTIPTDFVLYDVAARRATAQEVVATHPSSCTSFESAFVEMGAYIGKCDRPLQVVFMTDGHDNRSIHGVEGPLEDLAATIANVSYPVTVHVIGFTEGHNRRLMESLSEAGTTPGVYRYAKGKDLEQRFGEMFDFLGAVTRVEVKVGDKVVTCDAVRSGCLALVDAMVPGAVDGSEVVVDGQARRLEQRQPDVGFEIRSVDELTIMTQEDLDHAQGRLKAVNVGKANKAERDRVHEMRQEAQARLDKYHAVFAAAARSRVGQSETLAAELSSLRHEATFRKARRARAMDRRATANEAGVELVDELLRSMHDAEPLGIDLTCALSAATLDEVMVDSHRDFFVFSMRVKRTEDVIDAPSQLELLQVCAGTYSNEAFQEGARFALRSGPDAAHGGFTDRSAVLGEEVGLFKGPDGAMMNACLPMYVSEQHFARVLVQIKPILGYYFTLDPLGYHGDQLLAVFGVLGQLLMKSAQKPGEWLRGVVDDFAKVCRGLKPLALDHLAAGFGGLAARGDLYEDFVRSPRFRTKNALPNLAVLIGWRHACGQPRTVQFDLAFTEELWRRNFSQLYKGQPRDAINAALCSLLYGQDDERKPLAEIQRADQPVRAESTEKMDKQFAAWGKYKTDRLSQKQAKYIVKKFGPGGPELERSGTSPDVDRPVKAYEDDAEFFDGIVAEQLKMIELANKYCAPLFAGMTLGKGFEGKTKRLMLIQALQYVGNDSMNAAVASGAYANTFDAQPESVTANLDAKFKKVWREQREALLEQQQAFATARRIAAARDLDAFVGRLAVACPTRGGMVFGRLVAALVSGTWALHREKVEVVMTGKAHGVGVLGAGTSWVHCPLETATKFRDVIGEAFDEIEVQMHGRWGWVYRESDIPNRHGHCNSNPNAELVTKFESFFPTPRVTR